MIGLEEALEAAILEIIAEDAGVKGYLGNPVRVVGVKTPRPMFPYLEVVSHESESTGGVEAELTLHRIDLQVVSRQADGVEAKAAMAAVRAALNADGPVMSDWRCVVLAPVFTDTVRRRVGEWRTTLRLKAIVEPV